MALYKGYVLLVQLFIGFHTGLISSIESNSSVLSINPSTSFPVTSSSSSAATPSSTANTFHPASSVPELSPVTPLSSSVASSAQSLFPSSSPRSSIDSVASSPFITATTVFAPSSSSSSPPFTAESTAPTQSSSSSGLGTVVASPTLTPSAPSSSSSRSSSSETTSTPSSAPGTPGVVTTSSTITQPPTPTGTRSPESSSSVWSTTQPVSSNITEASVYIQVAFRIPWGRFCNLISLFKDSLSKDLIEMDGFQYRLVSPKRIKPMNVEKACEDRTKRKNDAVLEFYVSNSEEDLGVKNVSKDLTLRAYRILYDYWVNKRMILLDKTFENKVTEVKLEGDDAVSKREGYTDGERVVIGIGVALGLIFLIVAIYLLLSCRRNGRQAQAKAMEERTIIANRAAVDNDTTETVEPRDGPPSENNPENDIPVIRVHTPPGLPRAQTPGPGFQTNKEEPVLEITGNYETAPSEEEPTEGGAPLAKPEFDNVSEGEPIRDSEESGAVTTPDEAEEATSEAPSPDTARPDTPTEDVDNETSSDTENASLDEKTKPDFDQAEDLNADRNEGVINLGFDEVEEPARDETEETKF